MSHAVDLSRRSSGTRDRQAPYALLLAFIIAFSIYKTLVIGFGRAGELWLSCSVDASFWALCWLAAEFAAQRRPIGQAYAARAFYVLLYVSGAAVFVHTFFYDDAAERRLTLLDLSAKSLRQFMQDFSLAGWCALGGLIAGVHALAYVIFRWVQRPRFSHALPVVLALCGVSAISSFLAPRTPPSALFDTTFGLWHLLSAPHVRALPLPPQLRAHNRLDKSGATSLPTPRFKKVVVLVMETTTRERFERDLPRVPARSFFRARQHVHQYERYFPNNQDSRTGMLAMLTSRVIPYEAYSEDYAEAYGNVARIETLIDLMRKLGYRSAFALSQVVPEEVVRDMPWDEILHLTEEERPKLEQQKFLCLVPDPWESSCDDRVMIPRIVDFLGGSERAFVFQEFIWGHAIEYNQASGQSNGEFYSRYADELIAALAQRGLLDETLIAITSDHGYRGAPVQHQLKELHIPLWFYATRFAPRSDARLLSHVDFKDLLFDELSETRAFSTPNQHVFVQGPTRSGMLSSISESGVLTLLKQRDGKHMLWAREPSSEQDALDPGQLLHLFEQHKQRFDAALRATAH